MPISGCSLVETEQMTMPIRCFEGILLNGTKGNNNWYVSPVVVILDFQSNRTYYRIDQHDWNVYTGPFVVSADGVHNITCYYIDQEGNPSQEYSALFKIDQTAPVIAEVTAQRIGFLKWEFLVNVTDVTSGVDKVEFYVDDVLLGAVTAPPFGLVYVFSLWTMLRLFIIIEVLHQYWRGLDAIVYDHAGNFIQIELP